MTSPDESHHYGVIEPPKAPNLPGTVIYRKYADDALDAATADVYVHALNCVRSFGDFHMAVSAAPSNESFLRRLMIDPAVREFPWAKTHLWLLDEMAIAPDDPDRRGTTALDFLADHSGIPRSQVHLIDLETADPAADYEQQLGEHLGWRNKGHDRLDYVLLDMGTASQPHAFVEGSPALDTAGSLVTRVDAVNPPRITVTYRAINAARFVGAIVTGEARQADIKSISNHTHPYTRIKPLGGELRWYVDHAAAKGLPN